MPAAPKSRPRLLLRLLVLAVPVAVLAFLLLGLGRTLLERTLTVAFGHTERSVQGVWLQWDGDVVAKELVLHPYGAQGPAIQFQRVHLQTPGWFWLLRHLADRSLTDAQLDRFHLTLEGGSSGASLDPSLGDLGPFGFHSASPFEAEGCARDRRWSREELIAMGLHPDPPQLEFDYRSSGNELLTRVSLEARRSSRVQMERRSQWPGTVNVLKIGRTPEQVLSERWQLQDQGFVAARNRHCAKKDGIDGRRFLERHVQSVERLVDTLGLGVDPDSRTAYRRFARDGGSLIFGGSYDPPLPRDELYALHAQAATWLRMSASIDHNDRPARVQWRSFIPRPLAGLGTDQATWALLEREQAAASSQAGDVPTPDALASAPAPADTVMPDATADAAGASLLPRAIKSHGMPDTQTPAPTAAAAVDGSPATPDTSPAAVAPAVVPAPPAATMPAVANDLPAATSAADTAAATPAEPDAANRSETPPVTTTLPATAPITTSLPAGVAFGGTQAARAGAALGWDEMPAYRGRLVRIWTIHNPPRTVELLEADAESLRVSTRLGGGTAEYTVQRAGFLRARLVR